jgi:hypothetical protein
MSLERNGGLAFAAIALLSLFYVLSAKYLEALAQRHYIQFVQPAILEGDANQAWTTAEALLAVPANGPRNWQTLLVELHVVVALLKNRRKTEASRRLKWIESEFERHLSQNDLSRFWVINQTLVNHLATHGSNGLEVLLDAYKKAFDNIRLEQQNKHRLTKAFYEAAAALGINPNQDDWDVFRRSYQSHEKGMIRLCASWLIDEYGNPRSVSEDVDPSSAEGDIFPLRLRPRGQSKRIRTVLVGLTLIGGWMAAFRTLGASFVSDWMIAVSLPLSIAFGIVLTLRHRFHEGVAVLLFLATTMISLLF